MLLEIFISALALASATLASSPNGTYAPGNVTCPSFNLTRPASSGLSQNETDWLSLRRPNIVNALETWLPRALASVSNNTFNVTAYISAIRGNDSLVPITGLGFSGGGARASLSGYGAWQAFDERYPPSVEAGTGGIAQILTYLSGLSGGGSPTGAIAMSNFSTVQQLLSYGNSISNISAAAANNPNTTIATEVVTGYLDEIGAKAEAGFNVSITDIFAFVLGSEIIFNQSIAGVNVSTSARTWSDIQSYSGFALGQYPMPIVMANEVIPPGIPNITEFFGAITPFYNASNNTIYEINPFEYGAWSGRVSAFAATEFAGSLIVNGTAEYCVKGFDNAAFVVASAASAINLWYIENATNGALGQFAKRSLPEPNDEVVLHPHLKSLLKRWPADEAVTEQERVANGTAALLGLIDLMESVFNLTLEESLYAVWPNPFLNSTPAMTNQPDLLLVDGSEVLQEIPLWPIIQPVRHVDFVIANDAGGTDLSNGWMNGSSLIDTAAYCAANNVSFPKVPDQATFINYGFTIYPTFFGCNDSVDTPLVLYAADAPWSAFTNETFLQSNYNTLQLETIFNNTFNLYTFGNNTVDTEWSGCLACAVTLRSMQRMGMEIPEFCNACWDRHCWNGTYNSTLPNDFFEPTLVLNSTETYEEFITSPEAAGLTPTNASSSNDSKDATASESADASSASGSATKSGAIQLGVNFGLTIAMIIAVAALS